MSRPRRMWVVMTGTLILAIGALYVGIVLALSPYQSFWTGDSAVKLWQMRAWIASDWRTPWALYADVNAIFDPHHRFAPFGPPFVMWEGDRVLTIYTLPSTFVYSLLLAKGGYLALYAPSLIAGIVGLVLAAWFGRYFSGRASWLTVLVLGLATPWLFYSVVFWEHTVASVLVWAALALLFWAVERPLPLWVVGIAAGLCLGAAVAARPEAALCALALVMVLVVQRSRWLLLGWLIAGLALTGLASQAYQANIVGRAVMGQVAMNFDPSAFEMPLWSAARLFEMSQMVVESRHPSVWVILVGSAAVLGLAWLYRRLRPNTEAQFGLVVEYVGVGLIAVAIVVLLLRGHQPIDLLTGAPVVCFLVLGGRGHDEPAVSPPGWKRQLVVWCALVIVLSVALGRQNGGRQWGPRYLTPVLAPLILLSVERWEQLDRGARSRLSRCTGRAALAALTLAGVATQGVGVARLRETYQGNDLLSRSLLQPPSVVVITDLWFVPQIAPEVYGKTPLFVVYTVDDWRELEDRLAARGVERVRLVRLAEPETPLAKDIASSWHLLAAAVELPTVPPLRVADYARQEPSQ